MMMSAEERLEHWIATVIPHLPLDITDLRKVVAAARADERERACRFLCHRCDERKPLEYDCMSKLWRHDLGSMFLPCHAHELRCAFEEDKLPEAQPVEPEQ